jgi:cyclophilin family peptidyl-prolyl cis-trans isomerase
MLRFFNIFRHRRPQRSRRNKLNSRSYRWKVHLEALEDRLTPASSGFSLTAPAVVSGVAFIDSNGNGVRDPGELAATGTSVTLTGNTVQGASVNLSTITDASGQFTFFQVQPGTYSLSRTGGYATGQVISGNLGGTMGTDAITAIAIAEGQAAVNYNFGVGGLLPAVISLREFLSSTTAASLLTLLPAAGAGSAAADNGVQPSGTASLGTAVLAGLVRDATGAGIQGVQVSLTGIDMTGRTILSNTTTAADGSYQFTALQAGTYNLNVTSQTSGFRFDQPTVGSLGGQSFLNGQIIDILAAAGANGTGYNFRELPVQPPSAGGGVSISAALADDTAGPGGTTSDGITSDPSVQGSIAGQGAITGFRAGLDSTPAANFTSVLNNLTASGSFFLNPALMAQIAGGALANGPHTLHLQATDSQGHSSSTDVAFTLETTPPAIQLSGQSGITPLSFPSRTVTLTGHTAPGVQVVVTENGSVLGAPTTSDATGAFSFSNLTLPADANDLIFQATDSAGNTSQLKASVIHETGPVAVQTTPISESLAMNGGNVFVDLSDPSLFTDVDLSNSLVRLNTSAGPINLQLLDTQAPQTVANFFDYVLPGQGQGQGHGGIFDSTIFHRLVNNFVLQGGGFQFVAGTGTGTANIIPATAGPAIQTEFDNANRPDVLGTIAMATPSNDNGATNEFFFNLADNTGQLDSGTVGHFTVFGRLVSGADQRVINTLAAATIRDERSFNGAFDTIPLNNYTGTNFPTDTTAANFDLLSNLDVLRRTEALTFLPQATSQSVVTVSTSFGQLQLSAASEGTVTIPVVAVDQAGQQSAPIMFSITVGPISITNPHNQTNFVGDQITPLQINATDTATGHGTLTFSESGLPNGLTISTSGMITGTILTGADSGSPHMTTITVSDGTNTTRQSFFWTVHPAANQTNHGGDSVHLQLASPDRVVGGSSNMLTIGASNLPAGLSINSTGLISGTVASGASSNSPFTVTATFSDQQGHSASHTFAWTISPLVTVTNPGGQTNRAGDQVSLQVMATNSSGRPLQFTATGLPAGLSIDSNSGLISGTIDPSAASGLPHSAAVIATDLTTGISSTQRFLWTVNAA